MKNQRRTEIKVGIFIIVGLFLIFYILSWAKGIDFYSENKVILIEFDNVAGLESGDIVTVNGVKKGSVVSIESIKNKVNVKVSLKKDTQLQKDAMFSIIMLDLMGGKKVEISPGVSDYELNFSEIQKGKFLGDIATAMASLSKVEDDLVRIIKNLDHTLISVDKFITSFDFEEKIVQTIDNINELTSTTSTILIENRTELNELITSLKILSNNMNTLLINNSDKFSKLIDNSDSTILKLNDLLINLDEFTKKINDDQNSLQKFLSDENLYLKLSESINEVSELIKIINKQINTDGVKVDIGLF